MSCKADMLQLFKTVKSKVCYWLFPIINVWYKMHIKYSAMHKNIDVKKIAGKPFLAEDEDK
jgi:hypothetical protein